MFLLDKNEEMDNNFDKASFMCSMGDRLYIRDANNKDQPLVVFNPETLQQDEEATKAIKYPEEVEED